MLKISWIEKVRNEEVIRRAKLRDRELLEIIKKRKISYFGHIMREDRYEFQRLILEGKVEGKRGIGRKGYLGYATSDNGRESTTSVHSEMLQITDIYRMWRTPT